MSKELFISLTDPEILNPKNSPLLQINPQITGFIPVDFWKSMAFGRGDVDPLFFNDSIMKQAEANFKLFCEKKTENITIPQIIHFIWMGDDLPKEFAGVIKTWEKCHPGWEIIIWGNKEVEGFPWTNPYLKWVFENALTFGEKSDILRCEILFQQGGIYTDIDMICYKSLADLTTSPFTFFAGQETAHMENNKALYLSNSIIGSSKGNPILKECMDQIISQDEAPGKSVMERTGPGLITRSCLKGLQNSAKILILPCSYFYPLPHFKDLSHKMLTAQDIKDRYIAKESLTLHLWAATWYL